MIDSMHVIATVLTISTLLVSTQQKLDRCLLPTYDTTVFYIRRGCHSLSIASSDYGAPWLSSSACFQSTDDERTADPECDLHIIVCAAPFGTLNDRFRPLHEAFESAALMGTDRRNGHNG